MTIDAPFCDIIFEENVQKADDESGDIHHHYRSTLDAALKVTQCHPNPKYQFYPTLAWAQLYNQHFLRELLSMRGKDLSNSDRTPQIDENVSIAFDGTKLELGPKYCVAWIRRRQVEQLYNIDILHEGIILKRCRSRLAFHLETHYTRIGHITHQWRLFFKHEWDSIITRDFGVGDDWDPVSMADFKAPMEKTINFKML
jgi:hypothetical protein